jgi:hypothetical protein
MARTRFQSGKSGMEIDTSGVRAQVALMKQLGIRGADARPAFDKVEEVYREQGEKLWGTRGHGGWPRLKESTIDTKNRKGLDPRIMRAKGFLYRSLTQKKPRARWRRARKTELRWGTKVFYAFFHQEGRGVPVRKVIDIDLEGQQAITRVLSRYVTYGDGSPTRIFSR